MENQNENDPLNNPQRSPAESFIPPTSDQPQSTTQTAQPAERPTDSTYAQPAPEQAAPTTPKPKKWLLPTVLIAIIVVVLVGSGVAAFMYLQNRPSSAATAVGNNCATTAAPLTDSSAKSAYKVFVSVLKSGDQSCADKLSTDIFQTVQAQTYAAPDGKWLSKAGDTSAVANFKKLPDELNAEKLSTTDYVRADYSAYSGVVDTSQPEGVTVKYTVKSDGGYDLHLNLSFVELENEILVDDMVVVPASIDK